MHLPHTFWSGTLRWRLVFNFAYPIRKVSRADGTATRWFLSKVAHWRSSRPRHHSSQATLMMATGDYQVDNIGFVLSDRDPLLLYVNVSDYVPLNGISIILVDLWR